jgi:hypothetical protein
MNPNESTSAPVEKKLFTKCYFDCGDTDLERSTCGCYNDFLQFNDYRKMQEENARLRSLIEKEKSVIWYTKDEMYHWLIRENYSEKIAKELSDKWAEHLQGAFEKGFEKARRALSIKFNSYDSGMSEYFRMHDYRNMYSLWEQFKKDNNI